MAAKIIAQIVIQGTTILTKAFFTAYQQALHNAKSGGAAAPNMAAKVMKYKLHPDEALQILNIDKTLLSRGTLDERYKILFAANDTKKGGSFYLQSKIFRAKEVLDSELKAAEKAADGEAATGDGTTEKPADDTGTEKTEKK